jgi:serine/threonine protein kinase
VVLKFPPREAAAVEPLRHAFIREAWNATRLSSPDLVRSWMPESSPLRWYAMEFIDAPTLRATLGTRRLGVEEARELAAFLLRAGQFLLRHDLAHGDIKPDNILVLSAPDRTTFRLLDLGSAVELFSVTSRAGTASYLAPERFHGAAVSERTEIFAVGVTLHEALTGTCPYGEVERFQTPRFDSTLRPPSRLNAAIPPWLDAILLRSLDPDPERRYQHFSEVAYDCEHPGQVAPHHRRDAPLLERNPLLFFKGLSFVLLGVVVWLLVLLSRR